MAGAVDYLTAAENEFVAEDDLITIVPNVRMEPLDLICGYYGPFLPQVPIQVPSWLGLALKKRNKCRLQPPDWMGTERLEQTVEAEKEAPVEFQPLPFHYVEMSRLVTVNEPEMPGNFIIHRCLEDVQDVRRDKIDNGFPKLSGKTHAVKMRNLSAMEVNQIRPFSMMSLESYYKLDNEELVSQNADDSQMFSA